MRSMAFRHRATWNEQRHRIEMHLESLAEQAVLIRGREIRFRKGETIHTESSYKFTLPRFESLAAQAGMTVDRIWMDEKRLFSVQLLSVSG